MSNSYSTEIVPRLDHFIDRDKTDLPGDYLPDAPGVLIANEGMLRAAGYVSGSYRPRGWDRVKTAAFRKAADHGDRLQVRPCGNAQSARWVIERLHRWWIGGKEYEIIEALVFGFPHSPIWANNYQAAMRLAEYCYPVPRPPVPGGWVEAQRIRIYW